MGVYSMCEAPLGNSNPQRLDLNREEGTETGKLVAERPRRTGRKSYEWRKNWCWFCVDSVLKRWPAFMRENGAGRRKEKPQGGKRESAGQRRKSKKGGHAAIAFSSSRVTEKQSEKEA